MDSPSPTAIKGRPAARLAAILIGLVAIGIGFVAARELWWVRTEGNHRHAWVDPILRFISAVTYQPWMLAAGVATAILALILIAIAFKPRPRTHVAFIDGVTCYMRPLDIARLATLNAKQIPGVTQARTTVNSSARSIRVVASIDSQHLDEVKKYEERIRSVVEPIALKLQTHPKLKVVVRGEG
ncbi:DUF6286 domain-containing protein [Corynebacterium pseudotuberculosis]|uniref:DUF6286 domain-containing protein n=1 Tax=Corynebacterium pseudotuberculosis 258 TaxID=1168865 RepID=A0AAU8PNG3_CORPS|nr:DUF6286 domain-containing protein [Corynebacterium pseudotuberculosis]AER68436.1 Hypothetical protein Cp106_0332 [Corynebacterium pseudotuberculosis 1/06-A]AEQ05901.1 hypothetical protein CPCIP5297_01805 [Corynebacterium pseudotuberculosis CIP 52.97]AFB71679.1 hypothetical protein CP316_01800 [Corynebacterium pseudotuberculosis 316]AFK15988.1 hypothetical protein CP258_01805 [Corynebacterium pseudotuberculosis 258]AKS12685.1 Hypothetical protein CpE19_0344 [Corynebacterium pseudotuberculosi